MIKNHRPVLAFITIGLAAVACRNAAPSPIIPTATPKPTATPLADQAALAPDAPAEEVVEEEPGFYGPYSIEDGYPENVNQLTGIPVEGAQEEIDEILDRHPVYVKISNHPPDYVVPQSGIQNADHIWEHQVEGYALTRLSAVFLTQGAELVGPIRSGRYPDLEIVPMYQAIYVASGFSSNSGNPDEPPRMRELMLRADWRPLNFSYEFGIAAPATKRYPREGIPTEHTLFTIPDELWKLADEKEVNGRSNMEGLAFWSEVPEGGIPTQEVVVDYPGVGSKAEWKYDEERQKWLRWMNNEPHEDRLTEEQLAFDNVVIVYAIHEDTDFPEDFATGLPGVKMELYGEGDAVVLRDGMRYEGTWRRPDSQSKEMIQFFDSSGNIIYFKPGQTWFQGVSTGFGGPEVYYDGNKPGEE